ncbi:hypothetical protein SDC9_118285 [bioreactor metagenome]|uniref:Uncharacterized protein n=1 Tax=bioreactor metagenome TaxID=1076179 RepID=A0A645C2Z4_9ZZZZ
MKQRLGEEHLSLSFFRNRNDARNINFPLDHAPVHIVPGIHGVLQRVFVGGKNNIGEIGIKAERTAVDGIGVRRVSFVHLIPHGGLRICPRAHRQARDQSRR